MPEEPYLLCGGIQVSHFCNTLIIATSECVSGVFIDRRHFYLVLDGQVNERQLDPSNRFVV